MKQEELDGYIKNMAEAVVAQQGHQFNSLAEANAHAKKTEEEIRLTFQQSNVLIQEGLKLLSEKTDGFVSEISKKLLEKMQSPEELAKIMTSEIQSNQQALPQFSEAVNSFYDCGDYHLEQCVLSVFLMLFPMYPQPYACYATLIWRKDGIAEAEKFYSQIVDAMKDPVLDYFAADCFVKAGNAERAKEIAQRALDNTNPPTEDQLELRQHLFQLLRRCG